MAKYCPKCRNKYYDVGIFCKKCKIGLVNYDEVPPRCPSCKKIFPFQDIICQTCLVELDFFQKSILNDDQPDDPAEYVELETIYETSDIAELSVIKSMFEQENIHYNARGENLQSLFAFGLIGGFNPVVGTIKIDVDKNDVDKAVVILKDFLDKNKVVDDNDLSEG